MTKHKKLIEKKKRTYVVLAVLGIILANAAIYAFTHVEGASYYGDDPNYLFLASGILHGTFVENPGYIFSVRLMSFMPIAFFYFLFGVSNLTSTLWNIVSYIGIVLVTFFLVRFFYDDKSALISAFLASIFPIVTQFAVNIGEDVPLTFVTSLAVLFFVYADKGKNRWQYFASGVLLVVAWLISYEAAVVILFVMIYALVEILRKKIKIDKHSLFFIYGIVVAFTLTFIYSYINSGLPFITITTNLRFYSGVGGNVNNLPTIPTSNTDLSFYIKALYSYSLTNKVLQSGNIANGLKNVWDTIFALNNTAPYGLYFYFLIPMLVLFFVFERRSYFIVFWFAFVWLFLEFGPMHVGINLGTFQITYLLAHRLERFLMPIAVPLCGIIGVGLSEFIKTKNRYLLILGGTLMALILGILYVNNYLISTFWYNWQYFPESIAMQAANYLRPHVLNSSIYVEALYNDGAVSFTGALLPSYFGYPSDPRYYVVPSNASCSSFPDTSYVVWSGNPSCDGFTNVLNLTVPNNIPQQIIIAEQPNLVYTPTNIYYVR